MVVWIQADYSKRGWLLRYVLVLIDVRNAAADNGRVPCSLRPERVRHVGVSPYRRGLSESGAANELWHLVRMQNI